MMWKTVMDFPEYEISEYGDVRRVVAGQGVVVGKILKWHTSTSTGYANIRFTKNSKTTSKNIHVLVAKAFIGDRPKNLQIRHLDGNKLNNHYSNLAYGTAKQNGEDKVLHGTAFIGEKNWTAKITINDAQKIRQMRKDGVSIVEICSVFKLCKSTIYRILNNKYWNNEASNRAQDRATR